MLRKKLLTILLLIVGCKKPAIAGCSDANTDNYNAEVSEDDDSCIYTTMYLNINPNFTPSEITTAIQIVIDSSILINKKLIFEKATYIINTVINIPSNAEIDFGESTIMRKK